MILAHTPPRDAAQQPDRVRVTRVFEHGLGVALLYKPPRVEDAEAAAHLPDDPEVVTDEQHGCAEFRLQGGNEVEHLGFHGCVESGRRLVQDQQSRIDSERHRYHDALLHAAG